MRQQLKLLNMVLVDILLLFSSVICAYLLRFDGNINKIPEEFMKYMYYLALSAALIKVSIFLVLRLYNIIWKYAGIYEMLIIGSLCLLGNIVMLSLIFLTTIKVPRSIFIMTIFIDISLTGSVRLSYRIFERILNGEFIRYKNSKKILVVGAEETGALIIRDLKMHPKMKSIVVAIIDDDESKIGKQLNGVNIVGRFKDIKKVVHEYKVEEIIIALARERYQRISEIYNECSLTKCKVKILPAFTQLIDESVIIQKIRDVNIEDLLGREPINLEIGENSKYLKGKVILVTGGGGSIGSELCRQIACYKPSCLLILDNYENNAFEIENEISSNYKNLNFKVLIANVREKYSLENIFRKYKPNVIFHAAAHKHVPLMENNPLEAIKNNILGTVNVAEIADKYLVDKFVLISTDKAVYPTNIMGATKRYAEMIVQSLNEKSKTEFVAVRFGNVLGSNGSVIPLFKKQIEQGGPVTVTDKNVTRYFMTIPEAVQLVIKAGSMAKGGEIFVLNMGEQVKICDLARNLIRLSGFEPDIDIEIKYIGLRPGEKLYEELLLDDELIKTQNEKILVEKPYKLNYDEICQQIFRLSNLIIENENEAVEYLKNLVPMKRRVKEVAEDELITALK